MPGPIIIFDKSALERLNIDEALWLDNFFLSNITPLFFVETLADLQKQVAKGRTPEQVVENIALKTPQIDSAPNTHHSNLCLRNLLGTHIEMCGYPVLAEGIQTVTGDKRGIVFNQAPELQALQRWQKGEFLQLEHEFARQWRRKLSGLDLTEIRKRFKYFLKEGKPKSFAETKAFVDRVMHQHGGRYSFLKTACELLNVPEHLGCKVVERWKSMGAPHFTDFAPYAAYVLSVDLFFYFNLAADLISANRPSNKIDIAYLYYLPFCMVFTSNDHLHAQAVPLFVRKDQVFIAGMELKADFHKLDEHYSRLPDDVKETGIMRFAQEPPAEDEYLIAGLWDRFLPRWRKRHEIQMSEEAEKKLVEHLRQLADAKADNTSKPISTQQPNHLIIKRQVPTRKGKWRIVPQDVEKPREPAE
jgi:hypothetical protein